MAFANLLKTTATLQEGTLGTRSTSGEEVISWSSVSSELVMIRPARQGFQADLGNTEEVTHIIFARDMQTLRDNPQGRYRFLVGTQIYNMVEPHNPAGYNHHLEIKVRKVN